MIVLFEFLDEEPIENVITCLNYKIDKVVFFGYQDNITIQKKRTEKTLMKICGVQTVEFHSISRDDLPECLKTMSLAIEMELSQSNSVFFDITGGERMILVAFGILSSKYVTPIHQYDITANRLIELDEGATPRLSTSATPQQIKLDLDQFIGLYGGVINYDMKKTSKQITGASSAKDVSAIWQVARKHWSSWNPFSEFIRVCFVPDEKMLVAVSARTVINKLQEPNNTLRTVKKLNDILDDLAAGGVITNLVHSDGKYSFKYKNDRVRHLLWEGGSILEMHVYQQEKSNSDHCGAGVHIDWDGVIHTGDKIDVINEIDVLSIKDNIPQFISCKSGNMKSNAALHALYELETIADRFGGKYAKRILAATHHLNEVSEYRAREMGIEVRYFTP